ncbi:MAG: hypothetical protein MJZ25_13015 [Fibrobacter sp.]|nr:hypothetical protein [Fibrobacter sp.]
MWWLAIGATIGAFNYARKTAKAADTQRAKQEELEAQKRDAQEKYEEKVRSLKNEFDISKDVAYDNAALADKQLTKNEGYLSSDYNAALEELGLSQRQNILGLQDSIIGADSQMGNALSSQALSGTRGSSVMGAIGRQKAYMDKQLDFSRNMADRLSDIQLNRAAMGLQQSADNITAGRYQANELRRSYLEGGANYRQLQNNLTNLANNNAIDQTSYQRQIDLNEKLYDINKADTWDLLNSMFTGASMGYNFGSGLNNFQFNWGDLFGQKTTITPNKLNTINSTYSNMGYKPHFGVL